MSSNNPLRLSELHPNLPSTFADITTVACFPKAVKTDAPETCQKLIFIGFFNQHKILLLYKEGKASKDTIKDKLLLDLSPQCQRGEVDLSKVSSLFKCICFLPEK